MNLSILKERRVTLGLSQKKLGEKLGITQMYVSHLERGKKSNLVMLERMCNELDCELRIIPKA